MKLVIDCDLFRTTKANRRHEVSAKSNRVQRANRTSRTDQSETIGARIDAKESIQTRKGAVEEKGRNIENSTKSIIVI